MSTWLMNDPLLEEESEIFYVYIKTKIIYKMQIAWPKPDF